MAWFADLEPCTYFDREEPAPSRHLGLIAVGWLDPAHEYPRGPVGYGIRRKLARMLRTAWVPLAYLGGHPCEFCLHPRDWRHDDANAIPGHPNSFRNLLTPGKGCVYASPELIAHYIAVHEYRPPEEFCEAVLACPLMGSVAYFETLGANGSPALRRMVDLVKDGPALISSRIPENG